MSRHLKILSLIIALLLMTSCGTVSTESNGNASFAAELCSSTGEADSSPVSDESSTVPKALYILGDSYSAFEGYIPDGCDTWYFNGGNGTNDITDYSQMWWQLFLEENNMLLQKNNSYSGATICNTGYGGAYMPDTSFIGRFDADVQSGVFQASRPDRLIIFGGTNDSWADSPVGEIKWDVFSDEDLKSVLPAFCYLLLKIQYTLPDTEIITVINTEIKSEITRGIIAACNERDVSYVQLYGISKQNGHPDIEGMKQICEQINGVLDMKEK